jgi:hypothetical protein
VTRLAAPAVGNVLAEAVRPRKMTHLRPGWAEQD